MKNKCFMFGGVGGIVEGVVAGFEELDDGDVVVGDEGFFV